MLDFSMVMKRELLLTNTLFTLLFKKDFPLLCFEVSNNRATINQVEAATI